MAKNPLTVSALRKAIKGLPGSAEVFPGWNNGPPGDADPAVVLFGFKRSKDPTDGKPALEVLVDIQYLDDIESEEEDDG